MPERIHLSRRKGWRMPAGTVKVDRTTRWGNRWKIGSAMYDPEIKDFRTCRDAKDCVQAFRQSVDWDPDAKSYLPTFDEEGRRSGCLEIWGGYDDNIHVNRRSIKRFLAGANLGCWCHIDAPFCHADVLLELANAPEAA